MDEDRQETEVREAVVTDNDTAVERRSVVTRSRVSGLVVAQRIVWFIVGVINTLIALRFALLLLGANRGAEFTEFVYTLSAPFVAPFVNIFGQPAYGRSVFEISSLLAILVYTLIGIGIVKALTLARPQEEI